MEKLRFVNQLFLSINRLLVIVTALMMLVSVVFEPLWYLRTVNVMFSIALFSLVIASLLAYIAFFITGEKLSIKRFYLHFIGLLFIVFLFFSVEFLAAQF